MLLARKDSIRDGIAFPKTSSASDPMTGSRSAVTGRQLKDVSLRILYALVIGLCEGARVAGALSRSRPPGREGSRLLRG